MPFTSEPILVPYQRDTLLGVLLICGICHTLQLTLWEDSGPSTVP